MAVAASCHAVGCDQPIRRSMFLCPPHWLALPRGLRQQINATWGKRRAAMKAETRDSQAIIDHVEACDEARRWTAEGEGRLAQFIPDASRISRLYASLGKDCHD